MSRTAYLIHVAVGVIINAKKEILVALRPREKHQGGLWEFPGGKVEASETSAQALRRELFEELRLNISNPQPFIEISHQYADKKVLLEVFLVRQFEGRAQGMEAQEIRWVAVDLLEAYEFPAANKKILQALVSRSCFE